MPLVDIIFVAFIFIMFVQGLISLYLSLYIWESPDRIENTASPKVYEKPNLSFTVLLPARHEKAVIGRTIANIVSSDYPTELLEVFVICDASDDGTIGAAKNTIIQNGYSNVKVITFNDKPINKPHGLNAGLKCANNDIIVIFDAEDDTSPDIFNIANTIYLENNADVVQAGVQLMNYDTNWFSSHNVLEYYFWFKSRMHFQTRMGVVPLGGNTVFFKTKKLVELGGWREDCLTEDAEIGIRMSAAGAKIVSTYDPRHVTKEETPESIAAFIKQRTRWNQGFIQVLKYGTWMNYDTLFKRILCFYCLFFPVVQGLLFILSPISIIIGLSTKSSIIISLISFLPVLVVVLQTIVYVVGLDEFVKEQSLKRKYRLYALMVITLIPYQLMLGISALRATYREIKGINNWEKTAHSGLHRLPELKPNYYENK